MSLFSIPSQPNIFRLTNEVVVIDGNNDGYFQPCPTGSCEDSADYYEVRPQPEDDDDLDVEGEAEISLLPESHKTSYRACENDLLVGQALHEYGLTQLSGPMRGLSILANVSVAVSEATSQSTNVEEADKIKKQKEQQTAHLLMLIKSLETEDVTQAIPLLRKYLDLDLPPKIKCNIMWTLQDLGDTGFLFDLSQKYYTPLVETIIQRNEGKTITLDAERPVNNVPCIGEVVYSDKGGIIRATLARSFTFANGITLQAGFMFGLDDKDNLLYAVNNQSSVVNNINFPTNTYFYYSRNTLVFVELGGACTIQGVDYQENTGLWFDEEQRILLVRVAEAQSIGDVLVQDGSLVTFDEKGKLTGAILGSGQDILGYPCKIGTAVKWADGGLSCHLAEDVTKGSLILQGDNRIWVKNDQPQTFVLKNNVSLDGIPCKGGEQVSIFPDGHLVSAVLGSATNFEGITFEEGTRIYRMVGPDGRVRLDAILQTDKNIQGVPCHTGTAVTIENGKLTAFTLAQDFSVSGIDLQAQTIVMLQPDGKIRSVENYAYDFLVLGMRFKRGSFVSFGNLGKVVEGILAFDQKVNTIPCRGDEKISFYDNGVVKEVVLAEDWTIYPDTFGAGTRLEFSSKGQLVNVKNKGSATVGGVQYSSVSSFYSNHNVKLGTLASSQVVDGVPCGARTIQMYEDGSLARCYTDSNFAARDSSVTCAPGAVTLSDDGSFGSCVLSDNTTIQSVLCGQGGHVSLYPDGGLHSCVTATDQTVAGVPLRAGTWAYFYKNGKLAEGITAGGTNIEGIHYVAGQRFHTLPYWQEEREYTELLISDELQTEEEKKSGKTDLQNLLDYTLGAISTSIYLSLYEKRNTEQYGEIKSVSLDYGKSSFLIERHGIRFGLYLYLDSCVDNILFFTDCNCEAFLRIDLSFETQNNHFTASYNDITEDDVDGKCPACPWYSVGIFGAQFYSLVHRCLTGDYSPQILMSGDIFIDEYLNREANKHIDNYFLNLYKLPNTVAGSAFVKDVWIEPGKGLFIKYGYKVKVYNQ